MAEATQADRDAAADYCQSGNDDGHTFNAMRTGECDNHPLVQAFAAHRLAVEAGIVAWLRKEADAGIGDEGPGCLYNAADAIARRGYAGEGWG